MPHPDFDGVFIRLNDEQMKKDRQDDAAGWLPWVLLIGLSVLPLVTLTWVLVTGQTLN